MALGLAGCYGPFVPISHIDPESAKELGAEVQVYNISQLARLQYDNYGDATATSCKNLLTDPSPTKEDAINQLRMKAFTKHANGLLILDCEKYGTQLSTNCWSSVTCRATMVRVLPPVTE